MAQIDKQTEDQKKEKILEKVRKLLMMAEDGGITQAEAGAFAMKAQALMQEYNLSRADLQEKPLIEHEKFPFAGVRKWHKQLVMTLANTNFCRVLWTKDYCWLFGESHNIKLVRELYRFLWREAERLAKMDYTVYVTQASAPLHRETWKGNYFRGFNNAVGSRLRRQYAAAQAGKQAEETEKRPELAEAIAAPDASKMRALIVVQTNAIQDKINELYPKRGQVKSDYFAVAKDRPDTGFQQGYQAGKKVALHKQVKGGE